MNKVPLGSTGAAHGSFRGSFQRDIGWLSSQSKAGQAGSADHMHFICEAMKKQVMRAGQADWQHVLQCLDSGGAALLCGCG